MVITRSQAIPGVKLVDAGPGSTDARGGFVEVFRAGLLSPRPFVQENCSWSEPNVLRGLHAHLDQADLWRVERGRAAVVLVDLRGGRIGAVESMVLAAPERDDRIGHSRMVYIPRGVAHGFRAGPGGAKLRYLVDREYDLERPDEHGIRWNDPQVVAASSYEDEDALWWAWSTRPPVLSERDDRAPFFAQLDRGVLEGLRSLAVDTAL